MTKNIGRTPKTAPATPVLVIECKAENIDAWTDFEAAVYAVEDEAEAADMDTATPTEIANYYESG